MAFTFTYLKSAFTSLSGANVDVSVLRAAIVDGGIIIKDLLDQPEGIRWIDEVADPTLQFSFTEDLPGPQETELDSIVVAHTGPRGVSRTKRVYRKTGTPGLSDDFTKGYTVGDEWHDDATGHIFSAADVSLGAAVWNWETGWAKVRPTELVGLRASLQTDDESNPAADKILSTTGAGDLGLVGLGTTTDRGYFEDFGAVTGASPGPETRMDESPTLKAGRYLIEWTSELSTTASANYIGRFVFDRSGANVVHAFGPKDALDKFNGHFEVVLTAAAYRFELEVERSSGAGDAQIEKTTMRYTWIADS